METTHPLYTNACTIVETLIKVLQEKSISLDDDILVVKVYPPDNSRCITPCLHFNHNGKGIIYLYSNKIAWYANGKLEYIKTKRGSVLLDLLLSKFTYGTIKTLEEFSDILPSFRKHFIDEILADLEQ